MAVPAHSDPYRPGALVAGKYRLMKRIGSGAMGAVWSAVNTGTNGHVALKLIERPETELRQRLLREGKACASISHKNVVQVHDVGQTETGDPFLVMELLQGETLAALLQHKRRLPADEVALIGRDVARGLSAAHAQGIIHRDLKPANIFLHDQPGEASPVVKVLDFGVSKNTTASDGLHTMAGGAVGSPMYMSPEQARAERDIDGRADIWSLGVVLYEMLTGERPFSGDTAEVIFKIMHGEIPIVSRRLRRLDPDMDRIVAGCLTRDRSQRIASAADAASRLEAHLVPAAREPLLSLMDNGEFEPSAASPSGAGSSSPGYEPMPFAAASTGMGSTSQAAASSGAPPVSRSGSRPLSSAGSSNDDAAVDDDAATRPLTPQHIAPAPPPRSSVRGGEVATPGVPSADTDEHYGPQGTVRIDPEAVQAALDAHSAKSSRLQQRTLPLMAVPAGSLREPPPPPPPPMAAAVAAPAAMLGTPPELPPRPVVATRVVLIVIVIAVLLAVLLGFALWYGSQRSKGDVPAASASASMTARAPVAPTAPEVAPTAALSATDAPTTNPSVTAKATAAAPVIPPPVVSTPPTTKPGPRPPATVKPVKKEPCKSKFGVGCN